MKAFAFSKHILSTLFSLTLIIATNQAEAAVVKYSFEGLVSETDVGLLFPGKSVGDAFTGTATIDTDPSLVALTAVSGQFAGDFDLTIDGVLYDNVDFFVFDDLGPVDGVRWQVVSSNPVFNVINLDLRSVSLEFTSISGVPLLLPAFSNFDQAAEISLSTSIQDVGSLTSFGLQQTGVPAPATLGLFGFGLICLKLRRRFS